MATAASPAATSGSGSAAAGYASDGSIYTSPVLWACGFAALYCMCLAIMHGLTDPAVCGVCREKLMKEEVLPPTLASNSQPPNLLDGTTRLYISYICPYVQRVWIARNFKVPIDGGVPAGLIISSCFRYQNLENFLGQGLQDKIQLVAIDLQDKPAWYYTHSHPVLLLTDYTTTNLSLFVSL